MPPQAQTGQIQQCSAEEVKSHLSLKGPSRLQSPNCHVARVPFSRAAFLLAATSCTSGWLCHCLNPHTENDLAISDF